jgi:ribonuclease P protein component
LTFTQQTRVITRFFSQPTERHHETHLPTFGHAAKAASRFPGAHAYPRWQSGDQCPACQGSGSTGGVIQARATLPRSIRLRGAAHFTGAFPQRFRGNFFLVLARQNLPSQPACLGIVVSRKTAARAVDRASLRRLVREEFRKARPELAPVDFIVRPRRAITGAERAKARAELRTLLGRARA